MGLTILKTKLFIPPLQDTVIPRPRITDRIESSVRSGKALTLIAAPAGFGKTTVVSDWVQTSGRRVAWFSLDESDDEVARFWGYVIVALRNLQPDFGPGLFSALTASPPPPIRSLMPELINHLVEIADPLILVLDDYHVISNPEIHDSLSYILDHRPPQFHLLIASRADPPLSIARMRAQQMLTELRSDKLRFTRDEAQVLLNDVMQLGLEPGAVQQLQSRTEGWGVGLLLAAQSMRDRADKQAFIAAFSGSHHYILEYLLAEVLTRQPDDLRVFLLRTSILDALCAPLCDYVTQANNAQESLIQLYRENLFIIPLDQERIWYRYHHLFADLLVNFLHSELPEAEILELFRRAADWFEREGDLDKAIKYALNAKQYEYAAELIEQQADVVISRGYVRTLLGWIEALPREVIQTRPRLLIHQGWTVFLTGKVNEARDILLGAREAFRLIPEYAGERLLRGRLFAMLSTITALTRDIPAAIDEAQQALEALPENDWIFRARATRALGVCHGFLGDISQGLDYLEEAFVMAMRADNKFLASEILSQMANFRKHQGKYQLATDAYRQILSLFNVPDDAPPACLGYIGMAEVALMRDRLEDAKKYLNIGIHLCNKGTIGYALQPAYLLQGLISQARGDDKAGLAAMRQGENLSRIGGGSLESILLLAEAQTRFHLLRGDIETAQSWATGEALPPGWSFDILPVTLAEKQASLLAQVACRSGEVGQVMEIYARICPRAKREGRMARLIELSLFKAVALSETGEPESALGAFENCLALAGPEGLKRIFIEAGEPVLELLRQAVRKGDRSGYALKLLSELDNGEGGLGFTRRVEPELQPLIEPLTDREMDVLRLICEGFSNQAIANRLIVSVNTVKKHTSNIYSKLDVRNRAQAAIRAREIGLV